jgi:CheY-like chemotaxis protein
MQPSRSILLVEDDAGIRESVAECLEAEGYAVAPVSNGAEALTFLRNAARPDLIVCDLVMPVMDGAELIAQLAADHALAGIPVVLMSAAAPSSTMPLPRADGYLPKPFELDDLLDTVERFATAARA